MASKSVNKNTTIHLGIVLVVMMLAIMSVLFYLKTTNIPSFSSGNSSLDMPTDSIDSSRLTNEQRIQNDLKTKGKVWVTVLLRPVRPVPSDTLAWPERNPSDPNNPHTVIDETNTQFMAAFRNRVVDTTDIVAQPYDAYIAGFSMSINQQQYEVISTMPEVERVQYNMLAAPL